MKIDDFRVELTGMSSKKEALVMKGDAAGASSSLNPGNNNNPSTSYETDTNSHGGPHTSNEYLPGRLRPLPIEASAGSQASCKSPLAGEFTRIFGILLPTKALRCKFGSVPVTVFMYTAYPLVVYEIGRAHV